MTSSSPSPASPSFLSVPVPERLDEQGVRAMASALEAAPGAGVVVLEAAAGGDAHTFCAGMHSGETPSGDVRAKLTRFAELLGSLARCPRPTLALVDGAAFGGGLGLASICDVVLASDRARFGLPEALYGIAPAIIRPALRMRLSSAQLRRLLFTGHSRSAQEAAALGLCDEVVRTEDLATARSRTIRQLARARSATVAAVRRWDEAELAALLAAGVDETTAALGRPDVIAALRDDEEEAPWRR